MYCFLEDQESAMLVTYIDLLELIRGVHIRIELYPCVIADKESWRWDGGV